MVQGVPTLVTLKVYFLSYDTDFLSYLQSVLFCVSM